MKTGSTIRLSKVDYIMDKVIVVILLFVLAMYLYPLLFVLSASFSNPNAVWGGKVWIFPVGFTLGGYEQILKNKEIWSGYKNSIIITTIGVIINLFLTITCAYPLSRRDFKARGILTKIYMFTMFFGGGLIPSYLLVKNLGMLDTIWAVIIPGGASVTNIIITRTFFQNSIPGELREAAFLDGCTNLLFLRHIVLPLSKPIISVMALYYGVDHWNGFFRAMIYFQSRQKFPLQLILREIVILASALNTMELADTELAAKAVHNAEVVKYGVIIVSSLPALIIYPFIQKYFVKGVMIGSVKG